MNVAKLTRRSFVAVGAGTGAAFVLGFRCVDDRPQARTSDGPSESPSPGSHPAATMTANAFISIDSDGLVTLTIPKPDMGQGARTVLAMILAEELGVEWDRIKIEQATADAKYGGQGVGGSGTVRGMWQPLRQASAAAASMVCQAAAKEWNVDASTCSLQAGHVTAPTAGKSAPIGDFAAAASTMPVPSVSTVTPKGRGDYRLIGKPTKRVDNKAVVTGKAGYGIDVRVPDRKVAVVLRPHAFGGSITIDDTGAKAVPGYVATIRIDSGYAIVGDSTWAALSAADAVKVTEERVGDASTAGLSAAMKAAIREFPDMPGVKTVEATYELPYLSHATMEPQNCTARVTDDACEVWVPTQVPESARSTAAHAAGVAEANTTVHITLVGGGFGRRLNTDYVHECVQIAKALGKPVQLLWTRTDDLRHDYYRPATYQALKGAVDGDGNPVALYHQIVEAGGGGRRRNDASGPSWGGAGSLYHIESTRRIQMGVPSPVPNGAWRSVENTYQQFASECFFDELCAAGGKDPLNARLTLARDERLKRTIVRAAELAEWGKPMPTGHGRGVACFAGYGSVITEIAEVDCTGRKPKVTRMVAVVDCGLAVNPLGVQAQVQGAMMDGVSTTLHAAITIKDGAVVESNWDGFEWGRMADAPRTIVEVIGDGDTPGGMGEVGYPASGPAIANAIYAATGKRVRKLPVHMAELV